MKQCPYCGAELLNAEDEWCPVCGQKQTSEEKKHPGKGKKKKKMKKEPKKTKSRKKSSKKETPIPEVMGEPVDDGYDGYYNDVLPPDMDRIGEGIDTHLMKQIILLIAGVIVVIGAWVWENPRAQEDILAGNPVFILLNEAGGYRRARVLFYNLQVVSVLVEGVSNPQPSQTDTEENPKPEPVPEDPIPENYSLMAFQWVDAHILDINAQCNEAIGNHQKKILIKKEELPTKESWPDICRELGRNELPGAVCRDDGILINIEQ